MAEENGGKRSGLLDRVRGDAEEIKNAAERAALLTRQLLAFSRKQGRHPEMLDVNHVVRNVERMLNPDDRRRCDTRGPNLL
jgi:C4-dicarboxylate-specific signal transduction histidine kinase